jgi:ribosomal-protein-alanine N-acetyltransferase
VPAIEREDGVVRAATAGDLGRVLEIERESFAHPWPRSTFEHCLENGIFLVYEGEEPMGFLIATVDQLPWGEMRYAHIQNLAVDPRHRRRGVARELLAKLSEICEKTQIKNLRLEVRADNRGAMKFYKRQGFKVKRRIRHFYEDGALAYVMKRTASPCVLPSQNQGVGKDPHPLAP